MANRRTDESLVVLAKDIIVLRLKFSSPTTVRELMSNFPRVPKKVFHQAIDDLSIAAFPIWQENGQIGMLN